MKFIEWRPTHHDAIGKQTTPPFGKWGWDFLPLLDAWFWWSSDKQAAPATPGSISVVLVHSSDSGYEADEGEPDPAAFAPAEESTTTLTIQAYALVSGACSSSWEAIDERFEEEEGVDFESGAIMTVPTDGLDGVAPGTEIRFVGWTVPLHELLTEDDVEKRLLAPLRANLVEILKP
jgi:hypothetical protein